MTHADLTARIHWLECRLLRLDGLSWMTDRAELRRRCDAIDAEVSAFPDTRLKSDGQGARLKMLGLEVSCTAGSPGIYTNWLNRARTLAAEMEREDTE